MRLEYFTCLGVMLKHLFTQAHIHAEVPFQPVLVEMAQANIEGNPLTRALLVRQHVQNRDLEAALVALTEKVTVTHEGEAVKGRASFQIMARTPLDIAQAVISLATAVGETHLATELIQSFQKHGRRQLSESIFLNLAAEAVNEDDVRGIR